jgi:TorA maturation chaperone TorD
VSSVAQPVSMRRAPLPEDAARGDFYALLSRLLMAAPDSALLQVLAAAQPLPADSDPALARAWRGLADASKAMDAEAAAFEYGELFEGTGKAEVSIYAGFYTGAPAIAHPRVRLQAELAALGLARREAVTEPEDHIAGLLEVMRVLVAGGAGREPVRVAEQKRFFDEYLQAALSGWAAAVGRSPKANYYRHVAALAAAFMYLESESLQLD